MADQGADDVEKKALSARPTQRVREIASLTDVVIKTTSVAPPPLEDEEAEVDDPPSPSDSWRTWATIAFVLIGLAAILAAAIAVR